MLAAASSKKALITLVIALVAFCGAYYATLATLLSHWLAFDGNQSHAIPVILLMIYLLALKFNSGQAPTLQFNGKGLLLVLALSFGWYLAAIASIDIIEQLLLLPILVVIFYTLLGQRQTRALIPTLGLLIFVIPFWDYLVPGLVKMASIVVGDLVELSRIPALIDGNSFYLPDGKVDIVGGCSGVKYLTVSLFISYYILLTSQSTPLQKILLMLLAIVLSVMMNWVRIFSIILIAYYSKMESSLVQDHETYGWILFALVLVPIIAIGRRFPAVTSHDGDRTNATTSTPLSIRGTGALVLLCLALAAGPLALYSSSPDQPEVNASNPFRTFADLNAEPSNSPGLLTIDHAKHLNVYHLLSTEGELFAEVAEHWQTAREEKLVPYIPSLFNKNLWTLKSQKAIRLENGQTVQAIRLQEKPYGVYQAVLLWYTVGSYKTNSYSSAKLLQIPAVMLGQNIFRVTALRAECSEQTCDRALDNLAGVANRISDSDTF